MAHPDHLARADRLLAPEELRQKYYNPDDRSGGEGEHPMYTKWDWTQKVAQGSTLLGYWEWVEEKLEEEN